MTLVIKTQLAYREKLSGYIVPDAYYAMKLERLLRATSANSPREVFADADDDFWLWLNTEGYRRNAALRQLLPELPPEEVQLRANGLTGDEALADGFLVYRLFRSIFEGAHGPLRECRDVLDFGCGWGRVLRFFMKDIEPARLWGIDHYDKMIEICRQTNRWCNFEWTKPFPPTSLAPESFDLIFAYSVFSHLSEDAHRAWLAEFARLLRPAGIMAVTTWDREFIERCRQSRASVDLPFFQAHLPTMFVDTDRWLAAYDRGEYCFDTSVESYGKVASYLGETCIPKAYALANWKQYFSFVDFIDDRAVCPQNVIIGRK